MGQFHQATNLAVDTEPMSIMDDILPPDSDDFEILTPPQPLKAKVRELTGKDARRDLVAEAEAAVARLEGDFGDWMSDEVRCLVDAWEHAKSNSFTDQAKEDLYRAAIDLKGSAATLGYPLAGDVAASFCNIFDNAWHGDVTAERLLDQHVLAIRAIWTEDARDGSSKIGQALADELTGAGSALVKARQNES